MTIVKLSCFLALVLVAVTRPAFSDPLGAASITSGGAHGQSLCRLTAQDAPAFGATVCVEGKLTGEGVECQALRTDDGKLYTLVGDLGEFRPGDEVSVCGAIPAFSVCMQGTTIAVKRIRAGRE